MTPYLHRKYIDLIQRVSAKYINWDPRTEIQVGSYGEIDKETGVFHVEGNVYEPEFQAELVKHGAKLNMSKFPPTEVTEDDLVITTRNAKRKDWSTDKEAEFPDLANATIKGQWVFERQDQRGAILILHKPRRCFFPPNVVLEALYLVDKLIDKIIVTSTYKCPAYSMYLSEKSADTTSNTVSLALLPQVPTAGAPNAVAGATGGSNWWIDTTAGIFRNGYDETGEYTFTPLYALRRPIKRIRRHFRDKLRPEPTGDDLWINESPPWDPLDEEGIEDPLDPEIRQIDPFAAVYAEAAKRKAEAEAAAAAAFANSRSKPA